MAEKKIIVSTSALGKKRLVLILQPNSLMADIDILKEQFIETANATGCISDFGGTASTTERDLIVARFDEDFQCECLFGPLEKIKDKQKDIIITIAPPTQGILIFNLKC